MTLSDDGPGSTQVTSLTTTFDAVSFMPSTLVMRASASLAALVALLACSVALAQVAPAADGQPPPKQLPQTPGPELTAPAASSPLAPKRITLGKTTDKAKRTDPLRWSQVIQDEAVVPPQDASLRAALAKQHNVSLGPHALAFSADFSTFHKRNDQPQLVSIQDKRLTYYNGPHAVVRVEGVQLLDSSTLKQLGLTQSGLTQSALPVQLIQDGSTQLLVYRKVQNAKGDTLYKMTLYKVFGSYIGKVIDQTFAAQLAGSSTIVHTAKLELLRGETHPFLRVTPLDERGQALTNQVQLLRYNGWEGLYLVPSKAPTSPKRPHVL